MKRKKILSCLLSAILVAGLAACGDSGSGSSASPSSEASQPESSDAGNGTEGNEATGDVAKPDKIELMVDGTVMLPEAGQDDVVAKYKELTGIDLIITQPAHNQYYERVNLVFAAGDMPDALILDAENSTKFGKNGVLHDLMPLYNNSEVLKAIDYQMEIEPSVVDGQLFMFPRGGGDGTVTFVRQDWLDELGLEAPKNYDDFIEMLRQFKTMGDNVIPYIAPGIVSDEYPYYIYTPEFFQDAIPDFVQKDGEWKDGMLEPEMVGALERWSSAFAEGLIDMEIITNATSTCRDKQASGIAGVFNYWAGWAHTLEDNLWATDPDASLTYIEPIEEINYIGRVKAGLCITTAVDDPQGIFQYLFEYMYDQGEGQFLFTHGVEGIHYTNDGGNFEQMPSKANPTQPSGQVMLSQGTNINNWDDPYVRDIRNVEAYAILDANKLVAPVVPYAEAKDRYNADIHLIRKETLADIVYGNISIEDGLARYESQTSSMVEAVLVELNA